VLLKTEGLNTLKNEKERPKGVEKSELKTECGGPAHAA
jgi:hypothetical protein